MYDVLLKGKIGVFSSTRSTVHPFYQGQFQSNCFCIKPKEIEIPRETEITII